MTIPFYDLGRLHESIRGELDASFDRVLRTSAFIKGEGEAFEVEFAAAHDVGHGAGCGSGTDALALALRALGVGPGDEVIVPSMTFIATAEAVVHAGATPVVADVDPRTLLLTPTTAAPHLTGATKAIIPVHLYGNVVPPSHIRHWRASGLVVVEDAAQAHLGSADGNGVGTLGHCACFSFYPGKNLGALGDAGMVLSNDDALVGEVRRLRDHGRVDKYVHDEVGWCSRLDGLQAAALRVKLAHLPRWTAARREVAEWYRAELDERRLVPWTIGAVHHLLVVRVAQRPEVRRQLTESGIGTGIHYPVPLSRQPWLQQAGVEATPAAERAGDEVLSLPMDPFLTAQEVSMVCRALLGAVGA